jgi:hypothetical protein
VKLYTTESRAFRRVITLRKCGIWPGIRRLNGCWYLSYDPQDLRLPLDTSEASTAVKVDDKKAMTRDDGSR